MWEIFVVKGSNRGSKSENLFSTEQEAIEHILAKVYTGFPVYVANIDGKVTAVVIDDVVYRPEVQS